MLNAAAMFWVAFAVSAFLAYPCLQMLRALNSVSETYEFAPETHKKKAGTPNMGGIFVLIGVLASVVAFDSGLALPQILLILGFGIIGFVDDHLMKRLTGKRGLSWRVKLVLQFAIGIAFAAYFRFTSKAMLDAFIIITFANAYNFADGLDGLAASILIALLIPFVVAVHLGFGTDPRMAPVILGLLGAILPFLAMNAPPAKLFMGDVGALPIGALFGMILVQSPYTDHVWPWVTTVLLLVELCMVPIQVIAVKTIKRRVFASTPVHHAFEAKGWPETRIVWCFFLFQILLSSIALTVMIR